MISTHESSQEWEDVPIPGFPVPCPSTRKQEHTNTIVSYDGNLQIVARDVERFTKNVIKTSHCWVWTGAISSPDGYGRFTIQRNNKQRTIPVHRFALLVAGYSLDGFVGEHECNEPLCVRVGEGHLRVSTQAENLAYAVSLGRHQGNVPTSRFSGDRVSRSRAVRQLALEGWNEEKYRLILAKLDQQEPLFEI